MEHLTKIYKCEIFTCDICDKEYASMKSLKCHKKTHNVAGNFTGIPIKTSLHSSSGQSLLKSNLRVSTKSSSRKSLLKPNLRVSTKSCSSRSLLKSNISASTKSNINSGTPLCEVANSVTEHSNLYRQRQYKSTFLEIPIVDATEIDWGSGTILHEELDSPQFERSVSDEALDGSVE